MTKEIITGIAILIVVGAVVYLRFYRQHRSSKASASIVLLLSKPMRLDEPLIRATLTKGFGADFSTNSDARFILPVIEGAQYMVKNADTVFLLHNRSSPYFPDSAAVAGTIEDDKKLAEDVRSHTAWLSFDVVGSPRPIIEQYDQIGPVLSEFAPTQTVALYVAEISDLIRFDAERKMQLKGPQTFQKLGCE